MKENSYIQNLTNATTEISSYFEETAISGEGESSFLVASNGMYGIELYQDENGLVIVDPSKSEVLLGEREYPDFEKAVAAALCWLKNGEFDEITSAT